MGDVLKTKLRGSRSPVQICHCDSEKHSLFQWGKVWQACSLPPTLYLLFCIPAVRVKRKKMNVISLHASVSSGGWGALILSPPRHVQPLQTPPAKKKKKKEKFKAFLSAGICLCTLNVQSMTLSLIIRVTTSWAVRALALTLWLRQTIMVPQVWWRSPLWSPQRRAMETSFSLFAPLHTPQLSLLSLASPSLPLVSDFKQ